MTPVSDIELEMVFRIAVRGRARDLAQLLRAINKAQAVVIWLIEKGTASGDQVRKDITITAGGFSG